MRRDIQNIINDDIISKKRTIAEMLYSDSDIIEVLDNKELDPTCPDEYLYANIFPFIRIPGTQDTAKSYITFKLDDNGSTLINKSMKNQYLQVVIFVHKDLVKTPWGAERHDSLAYLVKDVFNLSNKLGLQLNLLSDKEGVTDMNYCTRTLNFEMVTTSSIKPYKTNPYEKKSIVEKHNKVVQREPI